MKFKFNHPEEGIVYRDIEFGDPVRGSYKGTRPCDATFSMDDMKVAMDKENFASTARYIHLIKSLLVKE